MLEVVDEAVVGVVVGNVVGVVGVVVVVVVVVAVVLVVVVVVLVVAAVVVVEVVVSGANKTRCYTDLSAHSRVWVAHHMAQIFIVIIFHANFGQSKYNKAKYGSETLLAIF